jgi:hypothetical protein
MKTGGRYNVTDRTEVDQRFTATERAVRDLLRRQAALCENKVWLRGFRGPFNDRPEFDEVAREIYNAD